ncbi:MAG: hypothetical protein U1E24_10480 [Phenylobacterium sp.]|nr:hypothetical protein [Phenylobacterium sp.]
MRAWIMAAALALAATPAGAETVRASVESGILAGEATDRARIFRNIP